MARQKKLPGVAGDDAAIEDIERSAEAYTKAAKASVAQRKKTADSLNALLKHMRDYGRTAYKAENGKIYTITPGKEKVTVTDADDADDDGAEE